MKTRTKISATFLIMVSTSLLIGWNANNTATHDPTPNDIIVTVKYKAQPDKGAHAITALSQLIEKVRQEPHFISIKLHVDPNDETNILLYEEWDDASYYKSDHMNTAHLQDFIANSRNFLAGPPELSFWKTERIFKP